MLIFEYLFKCVYICLLFFVFVSVTQKPNVNIADRSSLVKLAFHRMF